MSRSNRLMVGASTAMVSVLALGGYYAYSNAPADPVVSNPQPIADASVADPQIPERVAAMLASMDNRLEQYRADAMETALAPAVNEDALRTAIRSGVDEALAATRAQMETIGQANAAARTVSVELGEKAQQLLDLVAAQAANNATPTPAPAAAPTTDMAALEDILNLPPTAAGRVERVIREERATLAPGKSLRLKEVHFSSGSAELSPGARKMAMEALKALNELGAKKVRLVGFSDTTGSKARNDELSARRARAVASLLAANGVPASSIEVVARGESPGPIRTADGVDEPLNRCVGIFAVN